MNAFSFLSLVNHILWPFWQDRNLIGQTTQLQLDMRLGSYPVKLTISFGCNWLFDFHESPRQMVQMAFKVICTDSLIGLCFNPVMQYAYSGQQTNFLLHVFTILSWQKTVMELMIYTSHLWLIMKINKSSIKHETADVLCRFVWIPLFFSFFSKKMKSLKKLNDLSCARFLLVFQRLWFHHQSNQR